MLFSRSKDGDDSVGDLTEGEIADVKVTIPVVEGVNAGGSYSVAQLMVKGGDVAWTGATTRVAKNSASPAGPTCRRSSTRPTPTRPSYATR